MTTTCTCRTRFRWSMAFINSGKQFELMLYPRKTHGIGGKQARSHLFHLIEDHFEQYLAPAK